MNRVRDVLSDEQLIALGCVVAESSQLESTLTWILLSVIDRDRKNVEKMQFQDKVKRFKAVAEARPAADDWQELYGLLDHIEELGLDRNTAVHGIWKPPGGDTLSNQIMLMTGRYAKGDAQATNVNRRGEEATIDVVQLGYLAAELHASGGLLFDLWKRIWVDPTNAESTAD